MKQVVLLSGGLDSAVCLALNPDADALTVDYGQASNAEEGRAAARIAAFYEVNHHTAAVALPCRPTRTDPAMVVPGRNLVLLALAATLGEPIIGCNADDHEVYEDCRPAFFDALGLTVVAPLLWLRKARVASLAHELGVPLDLIWSCYYPHDGEPCDSCDACRARAKALA